MRWQQVVQKIISECTSLAMLPSGPKMGLRVVNYHSVGGTALGDLHGLSSISEELFKKHITYLENYEIAHANTFEIKGNELLVAITFDDGYKDNLYTAAPILVEKKMPFTVFIATDLVARKEPGFLTPADLRELAKLPNVTIGSHGKTHTKLTCLTKRQIISELKDSKAYLEDLLSVSIDTMSYPHGDFNGDVCEMVKNTGYVRAFTSKFSINNDKTCLEAFNRCAIFNTDSVRTLSHKIKGGWDWRGKYLD